MSYLVKTTKKHRFNKSIQFNQTVISFDDKGCSIVELNESQLQSLVKDSSITVVDKSNAVEQIVQQANDVIEETRDIEEVSDESKLQYIERLNSMTKKALIAQAEELELPVTEWRSKNKEELLNYIIDAIQSIDEEE